MCIIFSRLRLFIRFKNYALRNLHTAHYILSFFKILALTFFFFPYLSALNGWYTRHSLRGCHYGKYDLYLCSHMHSRKSYTRKLAHTYSWCMHTRSSEIHTHAHTHLQKYTHLNYFHTSLRVYVFTHQPVHQCTHICIYTLCITAYCS